jgi:hypothetical protein
LAHFTQKFLEHVSHEALPEPQSDTEDGPSHNYRRRVNSGAASTPSSSASPRITSITPGGSYGTRNGTTTNGNGFAFSNDDDTTSIRRRRSPPPRSKTLAASTPHGANNNNNSRSQTLSPIYGPYTVPTTLPQPSSLTLPAEKDDTDR